MATSIVLCLLPQPWPTPCASIDRVLTDPSLMMPKVCSIAAPATLKLIHKWTITEIFVVEVADDVVVVVVVAEVEAVVIVVTVVNVTVVVVVVNVTAGVALLL